MKRIRSVTLFKIITSSGGVTGGVSPFLFLLTAITSMYFDVRASMFRKGSGAFARSSPHTYKASMARVAATYKRGGHTVFAASRNVK